MSKINDTEEITEGNFPINLRLIKQPQQNYPTLMDKYKEGSYHRGYFYRGNNIDINLIIHEDNIFILSILQSYVLHW